MASNELEDTACSKFKNCIEADLIDSQILKASRILRKRKRMDTPLKRNFRPIKKAECSSNINEKGINEDGLEDSESHEGEAHDEPSMSPVQKRRKRLTAPAYFAILSGKKKRPWTTPVTVNKACRHQCVEQNSTQSSVGSANPEMSEYENDSANAYKIKCSIRVKILREVSRTENLILISDT
ncbi:hypothetical protein IEQ34_007614 [Dendrobium chrysotoxum]|uniref:Uncharacterized protein n=1 Tax=Dendrobium chrysotoxum TaxID=161865 RepID=A0AAV7H2B4_DENCH|nr:hypothetical protein IEQ34_007614 [Dendrobium chrysotoxum]